MIKNRIVVALAVIAALSTNIVPASAAPITQAVTVKWNTQYLASFTLNTNYNTVTGANQVSAPTIYQNVNAGSGSCTAAGAGSEAALTVNFGNVTPDAVKYTDCLYDNAANAQISTSDSLGYVLSAYQSTAATNPGSFMVCSLPNGVWANNLAVTASARTSNALTPSIVTTANAAASCGGGSNITLTDPAYTAGLPVTLLSSAAATAATNLGADYELVLAPNAASGANQAIITYTLTPN